MKEYSHYTGYSDLGESFRKMWIGVPRLWCSTTLPANHCWANGDFVSFADWPELHTEYNAGDFIDGMMLAWDADEETRAANLGKWRPDAESPTGLYTPNLSGKYLRVWNSALDNHGSTIEDGVPAVRSSIQGSADFYSLNGTAQSGCMSYSNHGGAYGGGDYISCTFRWRMDVSRGNGIFGNADTVTPPTVVMGCIIYLGEPSA